MIYTRKFFCNTDIPSLWDSPSTEIKDKKRILRLFIEDITVNKTHPDAVVFSIRWKGGMCETSEVKLPPKLTDRFKYLPKTIEKIRNLAQMHTDDEIVQVLKNEGHLSAKGKAFNKSMIQRIRSIHKIPIFSFKKPEEMTVQEVSEKFSASRYVVYSWIKKGIISARRVGPSQIYAISVSPQKEKELHDYVAQSLYMHIKRSKKTVRGSSTDFTVSETAKKFNVSKYVVYYWIEKKIVQARKVKPGMQYLITIDEEKEKVLGDWAAKSPQIPRNKTEPTSHSNNEFTAREIAKKFGVSKNVVYHWINKGVLESRKIKCGTLYLVKMDAQKEKELQDIILKSYRIKK